MYIIIIIIIIIIYDYIYIYIIIIGHFEHGKLASLRVLLSRAIEVAAPRC